MSEADYIALQPPAFDKTKMQSNRLAEVLPNASLEERCRVVVALHLERYPPKAIGMLGEDAWASIIKFKFDRTNPLEGKRRTAAITQHFLAAVEAENPHLAESTVADRYVWKDLCEFQFPRSGLSRPKGLYYPWPILEQRICKAGQDIQEILRIGIDDDASNSASTRSRVERSVQVLAESAMSVSLLKSSGIGKTVKKIVKHALKSEGHNQSENLFQKRHVPYLKPSKNQHKCEVSIIDQLQNLLNSWKDLAAKSGVAITQDTMSLNKESDSSYCDDNVHQDLDYCQLNCPTWRALFETLSSREVQRRTMEGARLRQRREHRAKHQPKVIKVRPARASSNREQMLSKIKQQPFGRRFAASANSEKPNKLQALKDESRVAANWQKSKSGTMRPASSSFGNAVAFASAGKSAKGLKVAMKHVDIKGGKAMKIPVSNLKKKLSKPRYKGYR